jgi:hypothetical protein
VEGAAGHVAAALEEIAAALSAHRLPRLDASGEPSWADRLDLLQDESGGVPQVVPAQLALACRQVAALGTWAGRLAAPAQAAAPAAPAPA